MCYLLALPAPAPMLMLCAPAAPAALLPAHAESLTRQEIAPIFKLPRAYTDSARWWERRAFGMQRPTQPFKSNKKPPSYSEKRLSGFVQRL